jgi:hypothetical protein
VRQVRGKRDHCLYLLPYRRWRVVPALARPVLALASCTGAGEICTGAGELYRRWRDLYWRWRDLYWRWRVVPALARSVTSNLAQGQAAARVPDKPRQAPMYVANRGRRGALNVHLQAGLLSNQVACCLMGQAIDQTV